MRGGIVAVILFGLIGAAILGALGVWQLQRLQWKEAVLAEIDARTLAAPVPVPAILDPDVDRYLPVAVQGQLGAGYVRVLTSQRARGPGFRIISVFDLYDGRRVMLDRGFVVASADFARLDAMEGRRLDGVGNLHWPDEVDGFTPAPDLLRNQWFARDVTAMAAHLGTEPVLIIAREVTGDWDALTPMPVSSAGVSNNHLGYAVQWFGLALVWLGMTAFLLWRIRHRQT